MKRKTSKPSLQKEEVVDFVECKKKLAYFRLADLQKVLVALNYNKNGKKADLLTKILDELDSKKNSDITKTKLKNKIDAVFYELKPTSYRSTPSPTSSESQSSGSMYQGYGNDSVRNPAHNGMGISAFNNNNSMPSQGFPIQPDVKLKKLAFFDILGTLLTPSTLVPINQQRLQEGTYYFHLTPQQASEIAMNRDIRNTTKPEYGIQIQLRFCLLETSCEQEDYFPPNVTVKVNGKVCPLPNPIPTNKPGVEPKRPPRPVNITQHCKLSPTVANVINVQWGTEFSRGYVISTYLVRKLNSAQLLQRMKSKGTKPAEYTRGLIKEKLNEDADCEIATTMLRVSLICPLGKMRMTTPCRASTCSHLQCFDASLYLQMNERKPTWNCPVCDKAALYENLVIDGYFQDVIASNKLGEDDNEIQLLKDGSWSTLVNNKDMCNLDTPSKTNHKIEISDDIEFIAEDIPKIAKSLNAVKNSNGSSDAPTAPSTTVDLTFSDSDDDVPLKKVAAKPASVSNKPKNDNLSSTIIMLDSPSPPRSTPSPSGGLDPTSGLMINRAEGFGQGNRHINPFASGYDLRIDPFEVSSAVQPNVNIVHPFTDASR